ncbi:MAG: dockerin type I domain-containing protein [Planctomycetota bacterium]
MAFELSTNEPGEFDLTADLNGDGVVDFLDLAIFANQWLQTEPSP